jgi:type IV pilus assembly protein PilC
MPKFSYIAIESASGKDKKGVIESASAEQAAHELKAMGLLPTAVNPAGAGGLRVGAKPAGKTGAASTAPRRR